MIRAVGIEGLEPVLKLLEEYGAKGQILKALSGGIRRERKWSCRVREPANRDASRK